MKRQEKTHGRMVCYEHLSEREHKRVEEILRRARWCAERAICVREEDRHRSVIYTASQLELSGLCFALAIIRNANPAQLVQACVDGKALRLSMLSEMNLPAEEETPCLP